jgi:hypothetical protein
MLSPFSGDEKVLKFLIRQFCRSKEEADMSRRSCFLTFLLIFILALPGLACAGLGPVRASKLTGVQVSPSSGSGSFTVTVDYIWDDEAELLTIICTHPGTNGEPVTTDIPVNLIDSQYTFTISVTKPGPYSVNCDDSQDNSASARFTVTGEPVASSEATKPVDFTNARITFDAAGMQFYVSPTEGTNEAWLSGYCFPPEDFANNGKSYFTVAEDGTLDGKCSADAGKEHVLGEISGLYSGGVVTFHLVSSHTAYDDDANNWKKALDVSGQAPVISGVATGDSDFIITCDALGWWSCGNDVMNLRYTGTVPFTITFLP